MIEKLTHPLIKPVFYVLFAILFYNSGLSFTILLLEPESFNGGFDWIWVALFPVLLPAFFIVNRYFGCPGGQCSIDNRCSIDQGEETAAKTTNKNQQDARTNISIE